MAGRFSDPIQVDSDSSAGSPLLTISPVRARQQEPSMDASIEMASDSSAGSPLLTISPVRAKPAPGNYGAVPAGSAPSSSSSSASSSSSSSSSPAPRLTLKTNKEALRTTAYQTWQISPDLRMPDGSRVLDNILAEPPSSRVFQELYTDASREDWPLVIAKYNRYEWTPEELNVQMALWGAEIQRLTMLPAFVSQNKLWYSRQLQVWLASRGVYPDKKLGEGSFGTGQLICPAAAPGACSMVIKIQPIKPGKNEADDIKHEYEVMRWINDTQPGLCPTLRSELNLITDAYNAEDPNDKAEFMFFAMDQWSGTLSTWIADHPRMPMRLPEAVLTEFFNQVTAVFQTNTLTAAKAPEVLRHTDSKRLPYLTNLDGLVPRNILFIIDGNANIARLGIGDWGFVSDPSDSGELLREWKLFKLYHKWAFVNARLVRSVPMQRPTIVEFFFFNLRDAGALPEAYASPAVALVSGPAKTPDSTLSRPRASRPPVATKKLRR